MSEYLWVRSGTVFSLWYTTIPVSLRLLAGVSL